MNIDRDSSGMPIRLVTRHAKPNGAWIRMRWSMSRHSLG
jgi:hypothetical protein